MQRKVVYSVEQSNPLKLEQRRRGRREARNPVLELTLSWRAADLNLYSQLRTGANKKKLFYDFDQMFWSQLVGNSSIGGYRGWACCLYAYQVSYLTRGSEDNYCIVKWIWNKQTLCEILNIVGYLVTDAWEWKSMRESALSIYDSMMVRQSTVRLFCGLLSSLTEF